MRKLSIALLALVVLFASCKKQSSEKKILSFKFASPAVEATIEESAKTIVAVVPMGTVVTNLVPMITISEKATVTPASGIAQDFTNPVVYTVMAEDGSQQAYVVTVTIDQNGGGGGGGGSTDPTQWSGDIDANTTWPDLGLPVDYIIDGYVHVNSNSLLTIEPGVTIMFTGVDGGIEIGENAGLKAVGTSEKPIVFTGPVNNQNIGAWSDVTIRSNRADNQLEYVQFLNGGSRDDFWDGVLEIHGKASVKNCIIDGSLSNGFVTEWEGVTNGFEGNVIKNCALYPWITENFEAILNGKLSGNNEFIGNEKNYIAVNPVHFELNQDVTLVKMSIPYSFLDGLHIEGGRKFIIEPGTVLAFESSKGMAVGNDVAFIAQGTESEPILFRGVESEIGFWNGLHYSSNKSASIMEYCTFDGAGNDGWSVGDFALGIWYDSKLTLNYCKFMRCAQFGIALDEISDMPNIHHEGLVYDCAAGNVIIESGGEYNGVEYADETILEDLP